MPKDLDSLNKSRARRAEIIKKYGEVPTSIWCPNYGWGKHIITLKKETQTIVAHRRHKKKAFYYDKELNKAFKMSSVSVRGKSAGLSTFPPDLARRIVLFYSKEGDTTLDPCAGHNSRMQITYELNRNYIGYDPSKKFMEFNREVKDTITGQSGQTILFKPTTTITLKEKSSTKLDEADNSIDMSYTSPPYWDLEYYGEEDEQLGYKKTYQEFLDGLQLIVNECYRVLKLDSYCIFNVNDFRKNGKYYSYHADVINLFENTGFSMHDVIIVKWSNALGAVFASQIEDRRMTAKQHEYLIVGKKKK